MSIDHAISAVRSGIDLIKTSDQRMSIQVGFCFCFAAAVVAVVGASAVRCYGCSCLLYTSDAADETYCVDLGGRRIIKNFINSSSTLLSIP